jgi:methylated-DNA-[protein]-cysteine S-methyltransferase
MTLYTDYLETPLGLFELMANAHGIVQTIFCGDKPENQHRIKVNHLTSACKQQLTEYFAGQRQQFDLPLAPRGTIFQQSVWRCLTNIPFGTVKYYGEIAQLLHKPKASQAIGGANSRNPISIIIPCHRVIGRNGSLTGYAGGIERKLWLLNHEGAEIKYDKLNSQHDLPKVLTQRQLKTQFLR